MKFFFSILLIFYFISYQCSSTEKKKFLSTKFDEVNLRKGPGLQHFIIAKFLKKGVPVEVIDSFDNWVKIKYLNKVGWMSKTQLTKKKYGMLNIDEETIYFFPTIKSKKKAIVKKNVIFIVEKCRQSWCKIRIKKNTGWLKKNSIWGIDKNEKF